MKVRNLKLFNLNLNLRIMKVRNLKHLNLNLNLRIMKYLKHLKARGVVKRYSQSLGQNFDETFASVVRYESLHLLLVISIQKGWKLKQYDMKSAFLYS